MTQTALLKSKNTHGCQCSRKTSQLIAIVREGELKGEVPMKLPTFEVNLASPASEPSWQAYPDA